MIWTFLDQYRDKGLLFLRIGYGLAYIVFHGGPKLIGGPERWERIGSAMASLGIHFLPKFWGFMAGFSESFGGILLILGFFTRPACVMIAFVMLVATLRNLGGERGFFSAAHSIENGIVLLALILIGPGRYALDEVLKGRRK